MFVFEHNNNRKQTNQPIVNQIKIVMRDEANNMMIFFTLKSGTTKKEKGFLLSDIQSNELLSVHISRNYRGFVPLKAGYNGGLDQYNLSVYFRLVTGKMVRQERFGASGVRRRTTPAGQPPADVLFGVAICLVWLMLCWRRQTTMRERAEGQVLRLSLLL